MSIVITGASGQLGRLTAEAVLERTDASDVVLVTRRPEALADFAQRGATVRPGDFDDPASLPAAFAGGERLLLISTADIGTRVAQHQAAIDAAAAAGVRSIAYTSIVNPSDSNPGTAAGEHRATEELIRASGAEWTFLRNGIYAEMLIPAAAGALASGSLVTNEGEGGTSYISRDDVAVAAAVILTSDGHEGRAYDLTGPEALAPRDIATLVAEIGGRPVEPALVDDDGWVAAMVQHAGMPEPMARTYATFGVAARQGYAAAVSTTFGELTGREPRTVREVLEAHRAGLV
jgi:NAD(P)H dehydrogenase (quinone)